MKGIEKIMHIILTFACLFQFCLGISHVFLYDRFIIKGNSMLPTYESGDVVWVNKLMMGARIYTGFDFSSTKLKGFRMPGFRKPQIGDVAIFNYPYGGGNHKIEFKINHVYAKRIIGCPGDIITIKDGICYNEGFDDSLGMKKIQNILSKVQKSQVDSSQIAFPLAEEVGWTVCNLGPLLVPAKGISVPMTRLNYFLYRYVIEYEKGVMPIWENNQCTLEGITITNYAFQEDYYYLIGDNLLNSRDSRHFGFVPELYIIGITKK